jgi:hypothetical protein
VAFPFRVPWIAYEVVGGNKIKSVKLRGWLAKERRFETSSSCFSRTVLGFQTELPLHRLAGVIPSLLSSFSRCLTRLQALSPGYQVSSPRSPPRVSPKLNSVQYNCFKIDCFVVSCSVVGSGRRETTWIQFLRLIIHIKRDEQLPKWIFFEVGRMRNQSGRDSRSYRLDPDLSPRMPLSNHPLCCIHRTTQHCLNKHRLQ